MYLTKAKAAFENIGIQITSDGRPYLGSPIGSRDYVSKYVMTKVSDWSSQIEVLSEIAMSQPHAAYSALMKGLSSKWIYLCRTTKSIASLLSPLEECIRKKLIPAITGRGPPSDNIRELFSLPVRLGGLGISNPVTNSNSEYIASLQVSSSLVSNIIEQQPTYSFKVYESQLQAKSEIRGQRLSENRELFNEVFPSLQPYLQEAVILAQEKGASSWLMAVPIQEHGFALHKFAFCDAVTL